MLATSKGTNAGSDEALRAPELAQESVVTVPSILPASVFPANPCGKYPPAEAQVASPEGPLQHHVIMNPPTTAHNNVTDPEGHELQLHKAEASVP